MREKATAVAFGIVFGFLLAWGTLANPESIRRMMLLEDGYLYLMFAAAIAVGTVGVRLLRSSGGRALVTRERLTWTPAKTEPRHVIGAAIFGCGWAVSDACPGPIAAQLGGGLAWSVCTALGVVAGIELYFRRQERRAVSPSRGRAEASPRTAPGTS